MSGRLYLVATPIGHLGDMTYRAVEILKEADVIYCEDTRISQTLMHHYGITTPLKMYHEHNEDLIMPQIIRKVASGKQVALISDAGMPLISDPGYKLVQEVKNITVIPGASAVLTALLLSRFPTDKFVFLGFLPDKKERRALLLAQVKPLKMTLIFFVPPHDASKIAVALSEGLGNRTACLARELTKKFEETVEGKLDELAEIWKETPPIGECVLLVQGAGEDEQRPLEDYKQELLDMIVKLGMKKASAHIAAVSGNTKTEVYRYALEITEKR